MYIYTNDYIKYSVDWLFASTPQLRLLSAIQLLSFLVVSSSVNTWSQVVLFPLQTWPQLQHSSPPSLLSRPEVRTTGCKLRYVHSASPGLSLVSHNIIAEYILDKHFQHAKLLIWYLSQQCSDTSWKLPFRFIISVFVCLYLLGPYHVL